MRTIDKTIYKIDELSDKARERAINDYSDYLNEAISLHYITDDFKASLESDYGYDGVEVYYSGFYSQGDGACFTATVDVREWLKKHKLCNKYRLLYIHNDDVCIEIKHYSHYYYATSTTVVYENYRRCATVEDDNRLEDQLAEVAGLIEDEREELGKKLYKDLENEYEYQMSEDNLVADIELNGYEFYEDGSLYK